MSRFETQTTMLLALVLHNVADHPLLQFMWLILAGISGFFLFMHLWIGDTDE